MKKKAVVLADNRPGLIGQMIIQLSETNKGVFDEAVIFDTGLTEKDKSTMLDIFPCRFISYTSPLPTNLLESGTFKRFSLIMFARYEMFRYLDEYSVLVWIDTDMLIQGSLAALLEETKGWGFSILCEDPINKSAKNVDYMRTNFFEPVEQYNMNEYLFCTGLIVMRDCLRQDCDYTEWCYKKTAEWAEKLKMPDQGVINALIQEFRFPVKPLGGRGKYGCFPYVGRDCSDAILVHAWGTNKFWNNYYLNQNFPQWENFYQKWLKLGGSELPREKIPEVSVVIPVYKPNLDFFRQCIDSLLAQMKPTYEEVYTNFEIIIVAEPFEKDEISNFVDGFHDPRLQLIFNEERMGIAASLNKGMRLAKGKYIARMDDDDIADVTRLAKQAAYLNEHEDITLCTSDYQYFGDMNEGRRVFEGEMSRAWSILTCPFDHPSIMFRRDFFVENDLFYDENRKFVEDWELWQRAFHAGMRTGCIKEVLFHHRWHNGSAGQNNETLSMMDKMIQSNFAELGVQVSDNDCHLLSPWSGKIEKIDEIKRVESYFSEALENNRIKKIYDDSCLKKALSLRLDEAETGNLSELVISQKREENSWTNNDSNEENKKGIKGILKRILKPLYQPFRHRYEDRLIDIQNVGWHIDGQVCQSLDKMNDIILQQQRQMNEMQQAMEWMYIQIKSLTNIVVEQAQSMNAVTDAHILRAEQALTASTDERIGKIEEALIASTDARIRKAEEALTASMDARIWKSEQALTASTDARIWKSEQALTASTDARIWKAEQALTASTDERIWKAEQTLTESTDARIWKAEQALTASTDARIGKATQALTESTDARIWKTEQALIESTDARIWKAEKNINQTTDARIWKMETEKINAGFWNLYYELNKNKAKMVQSGSELYDEFFYWENRYGSVMSARSVLGFVLKRLQCNSLVDFGCGTGTWLWVALNYGVLDVLGLDGSYIPRDMLMIPSRDFKAADLSKPFVLDRKFDMAMSLEVAEHLPEESADDFVAGICGSSDVVLFSAAHPGQGGDGHVNEQPIEYWIDKFAKHDYKPIDIKQYFASDDKVEWWYKENLIMFVLLDKYDGIQAKLING